MITISPYPRRGHPIAPRLLRPLLEVPLPAGVEAVTNDADYALTEIHLGPEPLRREFRDEGVVAFYETLDAGETLELVILTRVALEGRFHVMPAVAQEMYRPSNRGHSRELLFEAASGAMASRKASTSGTEEETP